MQKHKYQEAFKRFPPSNSYQSPSSSQYPQITTMSPSTQPPIHQSINCCCPIQVNAQENGKNSIDIVRNSSQFLRILPFQQKKEKRWKCIKKCSRHNRKSAQFTEIDQFMQSIKINVWQKRRQECIGAVCRLFFVLVLG